jgi:hypothetical protein
LQSEPRDLHQFRAQKPSGARPYIEGHAFFKRNFHSQYDERILRVLRFFAVKIFDLPRRREGREEILMVFRNWTQSPGAWPVKRCAG